MANAISIEPAVFPPPTVRVPYTLLWNGPFLTPKLPFPWGELDPHLTRGYLGSPHPTPHAKLHIDPSSRFLQDTSTFWTHTYHTMLHISSNRPHLYAMHIWCSLIMLWFIINHDICFQIVTYFLTLIFHKVVSLAMWMRCGKSFNYHFTANLLKKGFPKSVKSWQSDTITATFLLWNIVYI